MNIGIKFRLSNFNRPYGTLIMIRFLFPPMNRWAIIMGSRTEANDNSPVIYHGEM